MRTGLAAALVLLLAAGCKQPVGGRCQSHDDCESGVCSVAVPRTCRESGGEVVAADAAPPDAKVDARVDATPAPSMPDAASPPDAPTAADAPVAADADTADAP